MKISSLFYLSGIATLGSGIVFQFQGRGILGPESSFMFKNPSWISYGFEIGMVGIALICLGLLLNRLRKEPLK